MRGKTLEIGSWGSVSRVRLSYQTALTLLPPLALSTQHHGSKRWTSTTGLLLFDFMCWILLSIQSPFLLRLYSVDSTNHSQYELVDFIVRRKCVGPIYCTSLPSTQQASRRVSSKMASMLAEFRIADLAAPKPGLRIGRRDNPSIIRATVTFDCMNMLIF